MTKVLFDTNIILDIVLKRQPHFVQAARLFSLIDDTVITGFMTATTITDIYYITKKDMGDAAALDFIGNLLQVIDVITVDKETIRQALSAGMKDFEDAVQATAAQRNGIEVIITRNKDDFADSGLKVFAPDEFLTEYC